MKRINKLYITLFSIGILMFSCSEKFMDLKPHNYTSLDVALSEDNIEAAVLGLYGSLQVNGWYGIDMVCMPDVASDIVRKSDVKNSGRYLDYYAYSTTSSSTLLDLWAWGYFNIRQANSIIKAITDGGYEGKDALMGEAYFMRALAHFNLCQVFALRYDYTADASHLGVPVIIENMEDPQQQLPVRNTVAEVFTQVIADLQQAKTLLNGTNEGSPYRVGAIAVDALLARVYLYMGDWANAAQSADDVISVMGEDNLYAESDYVGAWSKDGTSESIFELLMQASDPNFPTRGETPGNLYSYYFYGDLVVDDDFAVSFDPNDIRGKMIYLDKNNEYRPLKFPGKDVSVDVDNFDVEDLDGKIPEVNNTRIIRLSEMFLTRAEANSEAGSSTGASPVNDINAIRTRRGLSPLVSVTIDDILDERKREMAFEGFRYFDLKRRELDLIRTSCNLESNCEIDANSFLFAFPIPVTEMTANPNMVQNTGY